MKRLRLAWILALVTLLGGCGYNDLQTTDEQVRAGWSEVLNQYQRRADLIPNLVNTVKGYAAQEQEVLLGVTNARAKVGAIQATPELVNDEAAFKKFLQAQGEMTSALSRLLVVAENYPQLRSNENFLRLQDEIAGTENRIAVERRKYNETLQTYNTSIQLFPDNIIASMSGFQRDDAYFKTEPGARTAPKVKF